MPDKNFILATIKALLPDGSAWNIAPGGDLDDFFEAAAENWLEAYNAANLVGEVRNPFETNLLEELERDFGFLQNSDLSEETRRKQLAAVKYENTDQRNSSDDAQNFLNSASFDVQVHANDPAVSPLLFPGDVLLNKTLNQVFPQYLMQCAGSIAFCGHQDAVCGRFNNFIFLDFEHEPPPETELWPFIYFVGGAATRDGNGALTSIAPADVPLNRKDKFIEFILSAKPWFDWAVLIINYV